MEFSSEQDGMARSRKLAHDIRCNFRHFVLDINRFNNGGGKSSNRRLDANAFATVLGRSPA
jgi:hypothetical protein